MTTNPYQVLGASPPPMRGRAAIMRRIDNHLRKPSPDHVSVTGPAHYGKSVLLRHVADSYETGASGYVTAAYIDLRRGVPASDHEFMRRFAEEIKSALRTPRPHLAEIEIENESVYDVLSLVFDELQAEGARLLAVLDGFDYALAGTGLTRNLWDQLRVLAQKASLRLVTGSRRRLRELCSTEDTRTSDFWEIFYDTPVRVTAFDHDDIKAFLQLLEVRGGIDESARKEIANWTGGVPLLFCALLQRLWDNHPGSHLAKPEIDQAAEAMLTERGELLGALWNDCDDDLRSRLRRLSDLPDADKCRHALTERGFGRVSNNRLHSSCRLMERYAKAREQDVNEVKRIFGAPSGFETNVQSLLYLRLAHVSERGVDEELRGYVNMAIRDLAPVSKHALAWVRRIANRALDVVWDAELPPDRTLPAEWTSEWDNKAVSYRSDQGRLPGERGLQCGILRLATGTERTTRSTRYIDKTTFLLIDHLHSVGNFDQHPDPESEVTIGFAAAIVLSAISLLECLAHDLAAR